MNIHEFTNLILWEILCFGLKMLFYILSLLGSIPLGLACYSICYHALAVSTKACQWHAILYVITPWQHPPRLGMLFYILSRLGSICRSLACQSTLYHALAVSAQAWHAILYPPLSIRRGWHAILYLRSSSSTNRDMQACWSERYLVNMLRRFQIL